MKHANGSESVISLPWGNLVKVLNCECEDGIARTAYPTGEADTFFSIPAYVNAFGRKVRGFLTQTDTGTKREREGYIFIAYGRAINPDSRRDMAVIRAMSDKTQGATPAQRLRRARLVEDFFFNA